MVAILVLLLLRLAERDAAYTMAIRPTAGETFTATVAGEAPGQPHGDFGGTVSVNGSAKAIPASGRTEAPSPGHLRVSVTLRWADVPADWVDRFRPEGFDFRLQGRVGGREEIDWSGPLRWNEVRVEGGREIADRYLRLEALELTRFSLLESEARARLRVRNPFSFPIKLAGAEYVVSADGRDVGSGELPGTILHPARDNDLALPIELDHSQLLAAAGTAIAAGGEVQGRLVGKLTVRLPGGDIAVPLDLSSRLSILSQ